MTNQTTAKIGSLFSGYGGLDMAVEHWSGATTAWHSEIEPAAASVLSERWKGTPNHGDITQIDWGSVEPVQILIGGFPCQDVSGAGHRRGMKPGTRSGLWSHMRYATEQLRPGLVVIENVKGLLSAEAHSDLERRCWCMGDTGGNPPLRALGAVLGDLADLGFDARWGTVPASWAGACHRRERVFVVAWDTSLTGLEGSAVQRLLQGEPVRHPERLRGDAPYPGSGQLSGTPERGGLPVPPQHLPRMGAAGTLTYEDSLLPTPVVNDMGNGKTVEQWEAWTEKLEAKHGNTNGHGRSLYIEVQSFGKYSATINRWSRIIGREPPPPVMQSARGNQRLNPGFVEWMMGLPEGWVTGPDVETSMTTQLKLLGNGVVPQQAELALSLLIG